MKGKIKFYNRAKDFGFITADDGKEYYFNSSSILAPVENDCVSFTSQETAKGSIAKKVKVIQAGEFKKGRKFACALKVIVALVVGFVVGHFL